MGILSNIFSKIFPSSHAATAPKASTPAAATGAAAAPTATATATATSGAAPAAAPVSAAIEQVDVEAILNDMAQKSAETLNWRTSIVDLLKLVDLDSSLQSRKELAQELHFTGDMSDSASMNIWLHRQVMNKLAANGGKVPADLKD